MLYINIRRCCKVVSRKLLVPAAVVVDGVVVFVDGAFLTFIILAVGVVVVVDVLVVSPSARYYIEYITLKYKMV